MSDYWRTQCADCNRFERLTRPHRAVVYLTLSFFFRLPNIYVIFLWSKLRYVCKQSNLRPIACYPRKMPRSGRCQLRRFFDFKNKNEHKINWFRLLNGCRLLEMCLRHHRGGLPFLLTIPYNFIFGIICIKKIFSGGLIIYISHSHSAIKLL